MITLIDQGVSSISNFAVSVAVARDAGAAGLGGFSFAYAGWLILAAMHRSLVTDPMAIEGDVRQPQARQSVKRGLAAEILLSLLAALLFSLFGAVLLVAGQSTFGMSMLVVSPWLPVLAVQDYWRWIGFMSRRPGRSLANDVVFNCAQGLAFALVFLLPLHSEAIVIASWGFGGLSGALFGLYQYSVGPSFGGGLSLLRERWAVSRWIAGSAATGWGASQMYVFVVGAVLGPASLGALRAAQSIVGGPAGVLIQAGGSLGLPEASRAYADKGWPGLLRVCRVVTVAGFVSFGVAVAAVVLWGRILLTRIYGPSFAHAEFAAVLLGIGYTMDGFCLGPILVVKATRNTHWLMGGQLVNLVTAFVSTVVLALLIGVNGAAAATVVTYTAGAIAYRWFQRRVRRQAALAVVAGAS